MALESDDVIGGEGKCVYRSGVYSIVRVSAAIAHFLRTKVKGRQILLLLLLREVEVVCTIVKLSIKIKMANYND